MTIPTISLGILGYTQNTFTITSKGIVNMTASGNTIANNLPVILTSGIMTNISALGPRISTNTQSNITTTYYIWGNLA